MPSIWKRIRGITNKAPFSWQKLHVWSKRTQRSRCGLSRKERTASSKRNRQRLENSRKRKRTSCSRRRSPSWRRSCRRSCGPPPMLTSTLWARECLSNVDAFHARTTGAGDSQNYQSGPHTPQHRRSQWTTCRGEILTIFRTQELCCHGRRRALNGVLQATHDHQPASGGDH